MDGRPWSLAALLLASILIGASAELAPQEDKAYPLYTTASTDRLEIETRVAVRDGPLIFQVPALTYSGAVPDTETTPEVRANLTVTEQFSREKPEGATSRLIYAGDGMTPQTFRWTPTPGGSFGGGYFDHHLMFTWTIDETSEPGRFWLEYMVRDYDTFGGGEGLEEGISAVSPDAATTHGGLLTGSLAALLTSAVLAMIRHRGTKNTEALGPVGKASALAEVGAQWLRSLRQTQWTLFIAGAITFTLFASRVNASISQVRNNSWVADGAMPYAGWAGHIEILALLAGILFLGVLGLDIRRTHRALKRWKQLESEAPIEGDLE